MEEVSLEKVRGFMQEIWQIRMDYEHNLQVEDDPRRRKRYKDLAGRGENYFYGLQALADILQSCIDANRAEQAPQVRSWMRKRSDDLISNMTCNLDILAEYLLQIMENPGDVTQNRRRWRSVKDQFQFFMEYLEQFVEIVGVHYGSPKVRFDTLPAP